MSIVDSIQKARKRGATDEQILKELIKQNPGKEEAIKEALGRGASPSSILNEIIKQNIPAAPTPPPEQKPKEKAWVSPPAEVPGQKEREIEEAKRRIEALKTTSLKREEQKRKEEQVRAKEEEKRREAEKEMIAQEQKKGKVLIEEEKRRRKLLERVQRPKKEIRKPPLPSLKKPAPIIRPLPRKPSFKERLWVRVLVFSLVMVLLAAIATFWYWYLVIKTQPPLAECTADTDCPENQRCNEQGICVPGEEEPKCTVDADCPSGYTCNPEGTCSAGPTEIVVPPTLFLVENTRELEISDPGEIRSEILKAMQEWQNTDQFRRVVIKNTKENKLVSLREFFDALQIRVPEDFYQKLGNNFTLFVYSQIEGNRIGFVTEILDKDGLSDLLSSQESTMKDDFKTLFTLMEEESTFAPYPHFRNANQVSGYTGPNFRFQTLTRKDLGICYLISDYYLVFTSSWKGMREAIERLVITGAPVEISKELKLGDRGYEIQLLQMWLKQDPVVYPEGKVTGYYGPLTKAAVIRFQEKYASEILAPQGLSNGTGEVDLYTRMKLNELYGRSGVIPAIPEITTDLRYGDHGNEVRLLQTWLAENRQVYPEAIISGWFGPLTKAAVIRFQEKYASEILVPQGLSQGTGIVDGLTRRKLNELYGD